VEFCGKEMSCRGAEFGRKGVSCRFTEIAEWKYALTMMAVDYDEPTRICARNIA
jgi:hypothetical protein